MIVKYGPIAAVKFIQHEPENAGSEICLTLEKKCSHLVANNYKSQFRGLCNKYVDIFFISDSNLVQTNIMYKSVNIGTCQSIEQAPNNFLLQTFWRLKKLLKT